MEGRAESDEVPNKCTAKSPVNVEVVSTTNNILDYLTSVYYAGNVLLYCMEKLLLKLGIITRVTIE